MKISKSQRDKKKTTFIVLGAMVSILVVLLLWVYAFGSNSNNDTTPVSRPGTAEETSDDPADGTKEDQEENPASKPDTEQENPSAPAVDDPNFISSPISNPPTDTTPYPIQNEHYKIEQQAQSKYRITLYPIANNPDYSDYNAQLKAYKQEALDYLNGRYGDTSNFSFEWNPDNAKDL